MRTTVYYFSGTGNSLAAARELAKKLKKVKIIPMAKALKKRDTTVKDECIGFIFPVYMWGLPLMVKNFIKKLKIKNKNPYIFALATYGGSPGGTLVQADRILKKKKLFLSAGFAVKMPGNYIMFYKIHSRTQQNQLFQQMRKKISEIAKIVAKKEMTRIFKNNFVFNFIFSTLLYKLGSAQIHEMDRKFWVDDNCNGCKVCYKVCPANNIKMDKKRPVWLHKCEHCLACMHLCPKTAIQFGKKTEGKQRYHQPDIKLKEFYLN